MTRWLILSDPFTHNDGHSSGERWAFVDGETPEAAVEAWEGKPYVGKEGEWWLIDMDDDDPIKVVAAGHYERTTA